MQVQEQGKHIFLLLKQYHETGEEWYIFKFSEMYLFIFKNTLLTPKKRVYILMIVTSTTEINFWLLSYQNKFIDIIKFVKHFVNSTTDTQR